MTTAAQDRSHAPSPDDAHPFAIEMLHFDDQPLRVGRQAGSDAGVPLLLFNGIGGSGILQGTMSAASLPMPRPSTL